MRYAPGDSVLDLIELICSDKVHFYTVAERIRLKWKCPRDTVSNSVALINEQRHGTGTVFSFWDIIHFKF